MSKSNVDMLRKLYSLYSEQPTKAIELLIENMADEVNWTSSADETMTGLRFARDRKSKSEVLEYFEDVLQEWEPTELTVSHFTAEEDRVYVSGQGCWKNRETGTEVRTEKVDFFRFKAGKIVEFREFFDTASVVAAAAN